MRSLIVKGASAIVVSQTWTEVNRVINRFANRLKSKGKLGIQDTTVIPLNKIEFDKRPKARRQIS
jgi:hypothetical protein